MSRQARTAEEIRAEVARLLGADSATLPLPLRAAFVDPLEGGANWNIPAWPTIKGDEARVGRAIVAVKARWDLTER